MDVIQLGGSLLAIVLLALLAWKLFPVRSTLDPDRITRSVRRYCPSMGSDISDDALSQARTFLSDDKLTAVVVPTGNNGIVIVRQCGDRIVVRHFTDGMPVHATRKGNDMHIKTNDFTMPSVTLRLGVKDITALKRILDATGAAAEGLSHA